MAYARHALLQFGGALNVSSGSPAGNEEWSCGIRIAYDNEGQIDDELTYEDEMKYLNETARMALVNWFTNADSKIDAAASLEFIKFNAIDPQGHYLLDQTAVLDLDGVRGANGGGAPRYPSQVSLAVSFLTGASRGRAKAGRIYVPQPYVNLDATGTVTTTDLNSVTDSAVNLINDLHKDGGAFDTRRYVPVIASALAPKGSTSGTPGEMRPITSVKVDARLDIQRRRGKSISAGFVVKTLDT